MATEMLAGDELAPGDPDNDATGDGFPGADWFLTIATRGLSTVEHTAKAFLGAYHELLQVPRPQVRPDQRGGNIFTFARS